MGYSSISTPRVSVVTAAYNAGPYIQASIDSILQQSFADFEFIIIDDGSTDETSVIAREATRDSRIRLVTQARSGIPRSLNRGTALSRGEFIARQDADDISLPDRLSAQVAFLEAHPQTGMVGSFITLIDEIVGRSIPMRFPTDRASILLESQHRVAFQHGSLLIRRTCLEAIGGYRQEFPVASDCDMYLRMMERFDVANMPDVLYHYRRTAASVSANHSLLQKHYLEIARELARQRRVEGSDILMRTGG